MPKDQKPEIDHERELAFSQRMHQYTGYTFYHCVSIQSLEKAGFFQQ